MEGIVQINVKDDDVMVRVDLKEVAVAGAVALVAALAHSLGFQQRSKEMKILLDALETGPDLNKLYGERWWTV